MSGDSDRRGGERPCMAGDIVAGHAVDPQTRRDVERFRASERERLYALRRQMDGAARAEQTARVEARLDRLPGGYSGAVVAGYWPIRGELDLRDWLGRLHGQGARVVLPVVVEKARPLEFHLWEPGAPMQRGIWNIPVPATAEPLEPDVVIVPVVGVDRELFRLGNGGGYYDMTLAVIAGPHRVIGVGQDFCLMDTVFPQPWDVAMDSVVLGNGVAFGSLSAPEE